VDHTRECGERTAQQTAARAEWAKLWPNHCKTCEGAGGASVRGDSVPYGSTYVSLPDEFEPCPDCAEKGLCSRCGQPGLTSEERGDRSTGDPPCGFCGWDGKDMMPSEPECVCYFLEEPEVSLDYLRGEGAADWAF
jgi:hypothetical protein